MLKYMTTAAALKMFSLNGPTCKLYRTMGNALGQEKRKRQDVDTYSTRRDPLVRLEREHGALKNARLPEPGTGWMHCFGLYIRLHEDVSVELFDVCDNRQLDALKTFYHRLSDSLSADRGLTDIQQHCFEVIK